MDSERLDRGPRTYDERNNDARENQDDKKRRKARKRAKAGIGPLKPAQRRIPRRCYEFFRQGEVDHEIPLPDVLDDLGGRYPINPPNYWLAHTRPTTAGTPERCCHASS